MRSLEDVTLSTFAPHVGEAFTLTWNGTHHFPVTLVEATGSASHPYPGRRRDAFQIQFRSDEHSPQSFLPQQVYAVTHEELGAFELFLVPIGPPKDGTGGFLYQAMFN